MQKGKGIRVRKREKRDRDGREELIVQCVNAVAEVLRKDNRILFVGRISSYDPEREEIRVDLQRGTETPRGMIYNTPIKLQVHPGSQWGRLVMLYGNVLMCAGEYWFIKVNNAISCADNRRAFRQKVRAGGWITWGEQGEFRAECSLVDISLVGVAFHAAVELEEGADVVLHVPHLLRGGSEHTLPCTVVARRDAAEEEFAAFRRYGCSFHGLNGRMEDRLCRDILRLQAQSINRDRAR